MIATSSLPDADPWKARPRMRRQIRPLRARESDFEAIAPRSDTRPLKPLKNSNFLTFKGLDWIGVVEKRVGVTFYTYRWYDPVTGRWPSRDPIEEQGGLNVYAFVGNDSVNRFDRLGLYFSVDLTSVDRDVLWHASRVSALENTPMTIESPRVGLIGQENELKAPMRAHAQAIVSRESTAQLCCGGEMDIDELVGGVHTPHIYGLGKINVQLKGRLAVKIANNRASFEFDGTYDPQTDLFDFSAFNQDGFGSAVVAGIGAILQIVTYTGSFDINFTGPVEIKIRGEARCPQGTR